MLNLAYGLGGITADLVASWHALGALVTQPWLRDLRFQSECALLARLEGKMITGLVML
jgi:hypothetical protein